MSASATVPASPLVAQPGGEVSVFVQIRNTGDIVDQYRFEVLGDAAQWAELEPGELSLFPDAEGEIKLTFRPPRDATTVAGAIPFGLKVISKENPEDSSVAEGVLEVGQYMDSGAELLPRTSRGRLAGKHELAFDNRGNTRVNATLSATDPDHKLRFRFSPAAIVSEPGTASFVKVAVRPKRKFLWGRPKTLPFKVFIEPEGEAPIAVDGTMFHEQLIPKAAGALGAVLALLALAWIFLLKPQIEDTAKTAAQKDQAKNRGKTAAAIAAVKKDNNSQKATNSADASQSSAAASQTSANAAAASAKKAQAAVAAAIVAANRKAKAQAAAQVKAAQKAAALAAKPGDIKLTVNCGTTCAPAFTVAKNSTLSVT